MTIRNQIRFLQVENYELKQNDFHTGANKDNAMMLGKTDDILIFLYVLAACLTCILCSCLCKCLRGEGGETKW